MDDLPLKPSDQAGVVGPESPPAFPLRCIDIRSGYDATFPRRDGLETELEEFDSDAERLLQPRAVWVLDAQRRDVRLLIERCAVRVLACYSGEPLSPHQIERLAGLARNARMGRDGCLSFLVGRMHPKR